MRKYQQLLLIIVSVISVSLLLIYRHEYNRLRYVLEVFNFFGQPSDCNLPELLNNINPSYHDWGPTPIWISEQNFALYSAFMKYENDIEVLVVHDNDNNGLHYCFLWFESNQKPVAGKVNYSKITNLEATLGFYKYNCHVDSVTEVPYAVSFTNRNTKTDIRKINVLPIAKTKYEKTTICVVPSERYSRQQIIEFISFHKMIGFDSFIVYNNNIPYTLMRILKKVATKLEIDIVDYPWNYPYETTNVKSIIEEDCLLRTKLISKNVIILNFNELLIPYHHFTVHEMLNSYDSTNQTNRFGLKVIHFCSNMNNNKINKEVSMLRDVFYDNTKPIEYSYIHRSNSVQQNSVINTQEISESIAAIHKNSHCSTQPKTTNSVGLRFSKDLRKSALLRILQVYKDK